MNTSPCHLSLFLPVGCRRIETEEKKREVISKRERKREEPQVEGGERERSLSPSHVFASRVCGPMKKDEDGKTRHPPNRRPSLKRGEGESDGCGMMYFRSW